MSAVVTKPASGPTSSSGSRFLKIWGSTVGLKLIMAATGVLLSGFVLAHMAGNLQVFQGAEALDAYGALLHKEPAILWGARATLLGAVGLHIWAYLLLTRKIGKARGVAVQARKHRESTFASRSMRLTGPLLLAFIVFHILHLTTGSVHPDYHEGSVYANLVGGLRVTWVGVVYILAMGMLALHLWHGVWSMTQTLGMDQDRYKSPARRIATAFTVVVCLGFAVIPIAVLAGYLK
ncbi:succinate dehydrogenase cytochrome b subunit [Tundrisphaera lichenicola]|uniref:succinate dehydrogenase cytochrome b subunit n=1 Tax=Tundrisphaera lichenicola TaxID=2029860 RepID=UPI003EB6D26E